MHWLGGPLTSIERTAYPRFKRLISARELHTFYTATADELSWLSEKTDSDDHLLAMALALKCFQRMGRFPRREEVPDAVVEFVRRAAGRPEGSRPVYRGERIERTHRALIRERAGVTNDPARARVVAEQAIRAEAAVKNNPADLINVALERLAQASLELPGFSTLDRMASSVRNEVNGRIFRSIHDRLAPAERARLESVLHVVGLDGKTLFNALKKPAKRASWSHFREQAKHLAWVDTFGDTDAWVAGVATGKIADFAGEAAAGDAAVLGDYSPVKRTALLACLAHSARRRARDDAAAMFCKRVATKVKAARDELDQIRLRQQAVIDRLVVNYETLLRQVDVDGPATAKEQAAAQLATKVIAGLGIESEPAMEAYAAPAGAETAVGALVDAVAIASSGFGLLRQTVDSFGGFAAQYADIEAVVAHHGDNYELLVQRHLKNDRQAMLHLTELLELKATSGDRRVLDALGHVTAHREHTRQFISDRDADGRPVEVSFASRNWQKVIRERGRSGQFARRHFEACVFTYLAEELRTGDVAVVGSEDYADWSERLLPWEDVENKLPGYLVDVGLAEPPAAGQPPAPYTGATFRAQLQDLLMRTAADVDAGYPDNGDLVIDDNGVPTLKRRRRRDRRSSAAALEQQIKQRMPERSLLSIVGRTAYWLEWWRRFGPVSGSDPKLADPFGRYVITTFTCGINMGPYEAARHIRGVSAHELSTTAHRHFTITSLNEAITDVINSYIRLDLVKAWGDGSTVAADGTHMDTYLDNLLAETSIRYGAAGGIAYHHISDHYVALFTHFIPCGVWEAVYIIEGLLRNASEVQPTTIHADTQGQSFPVFTLAHLLGFELMPRIRHWKDLTFYRPSADSRYVHIDALFGEPARNVIDWDLIDTHFKDLARIAISVREGAISSALLLHRLRSNSRRNATYRAFREVGRVIRTVQLLRYLSDPALPSVSR